MERKSNILRLNSSLSLYHIMLLRGLFLFTTYGIDEQQTRLNQEQPLLMPKTDGALPAPERIILCSTTTAIITYQQNVYFSQGVTSAENKV